MDGFGTDPDEVSRAEVAAVRAHTEHTRSLHPAVRVNRLTFFVILLSHHHRTDT